VLRISRLTDYGTMILVYMSAPDKKELRSASDVALGTHISLPTVQKLLKKLAKANLVESVRGAEGGYRLHLAPGDISAADILDALEGPVAITECSEQGSQCELEASCEVGSAWQRINTAIRLAMVDISLNELRNPPAEFPLVQTKLRTVAQRSTST
jgi:FeS assembly SUF system regulator